MARESSSSEQDQEQELSLAELPEGAVLRSVTAEPVVSGGRPGLRVALRPEIARDGVPGVDYIDRATFVELPISLRTGTIAVSIRARPAADAPDFARGFAGIAYRIAPQAEQFEAVYLRPTNGTLTGVDGPRAQRAIQAFAYPDHDFETLRTTHPDLYEAGAPIAPGRWARLVLEIGESTLRADVDGETVLRVDRPLVPPRAGTLGLFVDIGTEAVFADLEVRRSVGQDDVPEPES